MENAKIEDDIQFTFQSGDIQIKYSSQTIDNWTKFKFQSGDIQI